MCLFAPFYGKLEDMCRGRENEADSMECKSKSMKKTTKQMKQGARLKRKQLARSYKTREGT